jgi:chromosome partitioning protein
MPYIVAVAGQKGGTGKTTTAVSLAAVAAEHARVLLIDTDPQESATWWLRRAGDGLPFEYVSDPHVMRLHGLRELEHDVVVVDTPGSLQDRHTLDTVIAAANLVVLPTQPTALALVPLVETVHHVITPHRVPHRALLNIVDPRSRAEIEEAQTLLARHDIPCFEATVRRYRAHERGPLDGLVVTQYPVRDRYSARALDDYRSVARELFALGCPGLLDTAAGLPPAPPPPDAAPARVRPGRHLQLLTG